MSSFKTKDYVSVTFTVRNKKYEIVGCISQPLYFTNNENLIWSAITPQHDIKIRPIYIQWFNKNIIESIPLPFDAKIVKATEKEITLYKEKMEKYNYLINN
jgi:hypothetical protein